MYRWRFNVFRSYHDWLLLADFPFFPLKLDELSTPFSYIHSSIIGKYKIRTLMRIDHDRQQDVLEFFQLGMGVLQVVVRPVGAVAEE